MISKNLLKVILLFLFVLSNVNGQNNVVLTTTQSTPGLSNVIIGQGTNTTMNNTPFSGAVIYNNVFLGAGAGANAQPSTGGEASRNVFIGQSAGNDPYSTLKASGIENVYVGYGAGLKAHTAMAISVDGVLFGRKNTAIGSSAAYNNQGNRNTFIGEGSGGDGVWSQKIMTGNSNTFLGTKSGLYTTTGSNNIFLGDLSGLNNLSGSTNISIGSQGPTGNTNSTQFNILIGRYSGALCSGSSNTMIGDLCGQQITTGSNNTFLGRVNFAPANLSNTVILATGASWNSSRLYIAENGNAGFNLGSNSADISNIPENRLEIVSTAGTLGLVAGTAGLRFRGYTSAIVPTTTATKFLTVNATGDVILQNLPAGSSGTVAIANGTNTTVTGTGVTATPYVIAAKNIYTDNGTLTGTRTVTMGNNNLILVQLEVLQGTEEYMLETLHYFQL